MSERNQWKMMSKAIALASKMHDGIMDKGGMPYILHPLRVMDAMPDGDPEIKQIAVLHDVVEDTDMTLDQLVQMGFSPRVVNALTLLTHSPHDSYQLYIRDIKSNPDARQVKEADIADNSKVSRLKGVSEKDIRRMVKYNRAYMFLTDRMSDYEYLNGDSE